MVSIAGFRSIPLPLSQLSLAVVLKCGQSFRWSKLIASPSNEESGLTESSNIPQIPNVEYRLCLKDRVVCLRQSSDTLFYRTAFPDPQPSPLDLFAREVETLEWLKDYFQLNIDLLSLYREWGAKDKIFAKFQDRFEGIRMLRQDPWENLISFICSSNNNISRITKMIQDLCKHYSPALLYIDHPFSPSENLAYHPFPSPSALSSPAVVSHLRALGFGYRANYVQRTAEMLVNAHGVTSTLTPYGPAEASEIWLKQLRSMQTAEAREELLKFVGVGRKVADCILLMSLDKTEVVPVDTHVYQIAVKHYGMKSPSTAKVTMSPKLYEAINTKFYGIWGEYAGWAHSVLFTADLKSFSSYGLDNSPSSSPAGTPKKGRLPLKLSSESPQKSPLKRMLESEIASTVISELENPTESVETSPPARVKRKKQNRD